MLNCFIQVQLFVTPWPHGLWLPGSSVHGTLQARILEWVAIPFSRGFPDPGIEYRHPVDTGIQAGSLLSEPPRKNLEA